jgi:predicted transposase YbfD/YdcC
MIAQPIAQCPPLIDVLAEISDPRHARGKRHPLPAILALVCVATLCGYRSYSAIAQWARLYPRELVVALGLTHPTSPCTATLSTILRQLDRAQLEAKLGAWAESVLSILPPAPTEDEAVALDGKTLRGSQHQGALNVHLLSALSHRLGLTLGQQAIDDKTNEITHVVPLLRDLVLKGRIFTMDALLTQRAIAQTIVEEGGDYVMLAKGNQPNLEADVALVFSEPPEDDHQLQAESVDRTHGRIERRRLIVSAALADYSDWPGLKQVFRIDRETLLRSTGEIRRQTVYGVTSLDRTRADAQRLLMLTRHHWLIENRSHWVRDVTFDEDRSQVRKGSTPEVMAAFRNTAIGLLRVAGESNIAAASRRLAAFPRSALALIGLSLDN